MQNLSKEEFLSLLDSGTITPYHCYDLDIDYQQYYSNQHYLKNTTDTIDVAQNVHILFNDIETYSANAGVFPKPEQAKFEISAITIYSTMEKIYRSFYLLKSINMVKFPNKEQIPELEKSFKEELIRDKYLEENEEIRITVFTNELDLIKSAWAFIHQLDPAVLSGWSSDMFDLPYMYFRLGNLLNKDEKAIGSIMSKFGQVKIQKMGDDFIVNIPEYPVSDLMYLYKPRSEGGLVINPF